MKTLTVGRLIKICSENKYVAFRYKDNTVVGINCAIVNIKSIQQKNTGRLKNQSNYISYRVIDFQEYISLKTPFI